MSERIKCEVCGQTFNMSGYSQHLKTCVKQPTSTILTRKLADKMAKKRRTGFMIDTNRSGVFPEPASESVEERMKNILAMVRELNEIKLKRLPNIVNAVRSALKLRRAKRKVYNKFGVQMN
jgi:hypothetical protein